MDQLTNGNPHLSALAQTAIPSMTDMQFKLIDAKNALQHAAETAPPEVAKIYRQRALEVAEVVSTLARGVRGDAPSVFDELTAFAESSEAKPTFADAVRIALAAKKRAAGVEGNSNG